MFKISDFSRFSRVSVKMLRHYDEIGLLKPAIVDADTHYRYYTADQLPRLNRIIALKDLGFALEQIAKLIDEALPPEEIRGMLKLKRAEIEQQLEMQQRQLAQVEARLRHIEAESCPPHYDVVLRSVETQLYATLRKTVCSESDAVQKMFEEVEAYVGYFKARAINPPLSITYDTEYHEQQMDIEVAIPISGAVPSSGEIRVREIEGTETMACVVYTGCYSNADHALNALITWIDVNGWCVAGEIREVYIRFGADKKLNLPPAYLTDEDVLFVTELQIPVKKL